MTPQRTGAGKGRGKAPPRPAKVTALVPRGPSPAIMAVDGEIAIPRPALLRLALLFHEIRSTQEARHAQAA